MKYHILRHEKKSKNAQKQNTKTKIQKLKDKSKNSDFSLITTTRSAFPQWQKEIQTGQQHITFAAKIEKETHHLCTGNIAVLNVCKLFNG